MATTTVYPQLNQSDNFDNWKFRVNILLEEKCVKRVLDDKVTDEERRNETFRKNEVKAKAIIVQCVSDKFLDCIKDCETAKDMIETLTRLFQRKSTISKLYLKRKLLSLKLEENIKLEKHFMKFESLIRELDNTGVKIDKTDKVCHLLLTMNAKYDHVITAIETMNVDLTVDFVKSKLLDAELKVNNDSEVNNDNNVVFFSGECYNCRKRGHKASNCRLSYRGSFTRGRGRRNYNN